MSYHRECDLARNPRAPNKDRAYKFIQHLPVAREGFKHSKTDANAGYRRAELLVWNMALNGETNPVILSHAWESEAKNIHVANNRIDDLAKRTRAIIAGVAAGAESKPQWPDSSYSALAAYRREKDLMG